MAVEKTKNMEGVVELGPRVGKKQACRTNQMSNDHGPSTFSMENTGDFAAKNKQVSNAMVLCFPWLHRSTTSKEEQGNFDLSFYTETLYKLYPQFLHGTPRFSKRGSAGGTQNPQFKKALGTLSLPNDKWITWSKLKEFADHKLYIVQKWNFFRKGTISFVGN